MQLDPLQILSVVIIGLFSISFLFIYIRVCRSYEIKRGSKIVSGIGYLITTSIFLILILNFYNEAVMVLLLPGIVFCMLILDLIVLTDAVQHYRQKKVRYFRLALAFVGFFIGLIGIIFLYILGVIMVPIGALDFYVDRMVLVGIMGCIMFGLSAWGIIKGERFQSETRLRRRGMLICVIIWKRLRITVS